MKGLSFMFSSLRRSFVLTGALGILIFIPLISPAQNVTTNTARCTNVPDPDFIPAMSLVCGQNANTKGLVAGNASYPKTTDKKSEIWRNTLFEKRLSGNIDMKFRNLEKGTIPVWLFRSLPVVLLLLLISILPLLKPAGRRE